jgi:dTDP-4-amino-4,6-dideoxygalactose transaminase
LTAALDEGAVRPPAPTPPGHDHVFHRFVVESDDREGLRRHLEDQGIATAVHYPVPIHLQEAFADVDLGKGSLPVAEGLANRVLSLPLYPSMTGATVQHIAQAVLTFVDRSEPSTVLRTA